MNDFATKKKTVLEQFIICCLPYDITMSHLKSSNHALITFQADKGWEPERDKKKERETV